MLFRSLRFHLHKDLSPTYCNVMKHLEAMGWRFTPRQHKARFSETHFQFDAQAAEQLEYKHLLAQLMATHCPEIIPETYCINDHNWHGVLHTLNNRYYQTKASGDPEPLLWILKPALLNNGQHIHLFQHVKQLEQHFSQPNRLGGEHVLQRYIATPHLLKGHKYSIRMFVILTNYAGAFLYPHGYLNVALHPYQITALHDLRSHVTNEHLHPNESNVIQIPTQRLAAFAGFYPQIKQQVTTALHALQTKYPAAFKNTGERALGIFGFDFMVDNHLQVYLLEINHGPCFPVVDSHPLQPYLYEPFWEAFIRSFVLPIASNQSAEQIQYHLFEQLLWV